MVGYHEFELRRIERLYGINIGGDFSEFLLKAGRCDGGVIGDDPLIIYRPTWSVRTHLLFQVNFFNGLQEIGAFEFINKPFVFSLEAETQYYFLQTRNPDDMQVYHYDENAESVQGTGLTLENYLIDILQRYPIGGVVCKGELLDF
ncbi:hypothetical protein CR152_19990 [Massilia violaceinigra]|uniref:SMI1/KNR4 family protein n=2 Tax=Massilia violaceinigra TaxID=2045208 RepID=A0A2D2DVL8_9BURK|nr:hypothetical protein CR152_19990 [Massilia violaceinigra]